MHKSIPKPFKAVSEPNTASQAYHFTPKMKQEFQRKNSTDEQSSGKNYKKQILNNQKLLKYENSTEAVF